MKHNTDNKMATVRQKAPNIWPNRLAHAYGQRDHYKAQAGKLAEALRDLVAADGISRHETYRAMHKAMDVLAEYEASK